MAKNTEPKTIPEKEDVNPELAFQAAWDNNDGQMRLLVTRTGEMRTGLKPSEQTKAREILRDYGL